MAVGLALALAVTCAAILARRRDPLAAAILTGAVWFVPGVAIGPNWSNAAPAAAALAIVLLAYTLGANEPRARGLIGLAALVLAMSAGDFSDPVPPFMFTVPAWIAGEAVQARSRLAAQLAARARELDDEREAFAREAVRYERTRIARELHDIVAHSLSMMVVQAGAGQRQLDSNPDPGRAIARTRQRRRSPSRARARPAARAAGRGLAPPIRRRPAPDRRARATGRRQRPARHLPLQRSARRAAARSIRNRLQGGPGGAHKRAQARAWSAGASYGRRRASTRLSSPSRTGRRVALPRS